jgi:hypothetical protein
VEEGIPLNAEEISIARALLGDNLREFCDQCALGDKPTHHINRTIEYRATFGEPGGNQLRERSPPVSVM